MPKSIDKLEERWEYKCKLIFNNLLITKFTITDYYKKHEKHGIDRNKIIELVKMLNNQKIKPLDDYSGKRKIFLWDKIPYQGKYYRLIFWFKDNTNNHLWIRNYYSIN